MKPPLRTKSVSTKVSEAEFAMLEERVRGAGIRLAEWDYVRRKCRGFSAGQRRKDGKRR